ncbi:hypothetical protein VQ643_12160 [Pseudomonas sp. F1_0610]|uniref:hypothetical protein n=1 Tax=Pseudomonas sp. F1_0610 TaxID=3114284 RepID=UPI0039C09043
MRLLTAVLGVSMLFLSACSSPKERFLKTCLAVDGYDEPTCSCVYTKLSEIYPESEMENIVDRTSQLPLTTKQKIEHIALQCTLEQIVLH